MEKLLLRINGFGKFQKFILFLVGLISIMRAYLGYSAIFTTARQELECTNVLEQTPVAASESCRVWSALQANSSGICESAMSWFI